MAYKLVFTSSKIDEESAELECFANNKNEIYISIKRIGMHEAYTVLDRSTAIRLVKTLKAEINRLEA